MHRGGGGRTGSARPSWRSGSPSRPRTNPRSPSTAGWWNWTTGSVCSFAADHDDLADLLGEQVGVRSVVQLDREVFAVAAPRLCADGLRGSCYAGRRCCQLRGPMTRIRRVEPGAPAGDGVAPPDPSRHGSDNTAQARTVEPPEDDDLCRLVSGDAASDGQKDSKYGSTGTASSSCPPAPSRTAPWTTARTHTFSAPPLRQLVRPNLQSAMQGDGFPMPPSATSNCSAPGWCGVAGELPSSSRVALLPR